MKFIVPVSAVIFLVGCETMMLESNHASGQTRYVCYTYEYPAKHVLTLPTPTDKSDVAPVEVWFQGNIINATYSRKGLTQLWLFDDSLYVKVDADNDAQYWDFRGAEEGEERKPEAVFECNKLS